MSAWDPEFYDSKSDVQYQLGLRTIAELNIQDGESLLDIGCGTGRLTIEIAKRNPSGMIIGLDINPSMIKKANENLQDSCIKNIQYINSDILQYEPEIQFKAIFSNSALHWVQRTRNLYQKIYDLLLPGGRFVAQMPTMGSYSHLFSYFISPIQPLKLEKYFKNWSFPIKMVKAKTLQRMFSAIGYENINIWNENRPLEFKSPEDFVDFLKTAALVPFLSEIPSEYRDPYADYLLNMFKTNDAPDLSINLKRLFFHVEKGKS